MKGILLFVELTIASLVFAYDDQCPPEQAEDWHIEKLLRHEDCHKFYKCTYGKPVEMECPDGLYFNLPTWQCDWPYNVDCGDRNTPGINTTSPLPPPPPTTTTTSEPTTTTTTTTPAPTTTTTTTTPAPTTTTTTTTPAPPTTSSTTPTPTTPSSTTGLTTPPLRPNGCPINPHIHWLLPHESNCNLFYYCVWGKKVLRSCPSTLHFNRVIQVCDWPYAAGCIAYS